MGSRPHVARRQTYHSPGRGGAEDCTEEEKRVAARLDSKPLITGLEVGVRSNSKTICSVG